MIRYSGATAEELEKIINELIELKDETFEKRQKAEEIGDKYAMGLWYGRRMALVNAIGKIQEVYLR